MLRKTNYTTGISDQHNRFASLYKEDFVQHPPGQNRALNEENLKELTNHHFKLGFDENNPKQQISEHHAEYIQKSVPQADKDAQKKLKDLVSSSVSDSKEVKNLG